MPEYKLVEEITGKGYETHIGYYPSGDIESKSWFLNGQYHREDGPAYIRYNEDGSILKKVWGLENKALNKLDFTSIKMVEKMKAQELFTLKELLQLKRA